MYAVNHTGPDATTNVYGFVLYSPKLHPLLVTGQSGQKSGGTSMCGDAEDNRHHGGVGGNRE